MLSRKAQYSLANAKTYFEEHLSTGDYYSEKEMVAGQWYGEGAAALRLSATVKRDEFLLLCDNLDPRTGKLLTQRLKTIRTVIGHDGKTHTEANRRVFYDFTFSPPKSVSIAAFIGDDRRIVDAHNRAVTASLRELERFAATRVRTEGDMSDRQTGKIVAAVFRHVPRLGPAPAQPLRRVQRDVGSGGTSLEGAANIRHGERAEVHRECLLP